MSARRNLVREQGPDRTRRGLGRTERGPQHPQLATGALRVDGLTITGETELVHGISFDLEPGDALGIVGESGSGKTLTLRAIMGLLPRGIVQTGGRIEAGGRLGMIFQDPLSYLDPMTRVGNQLVAVIRANRRITRPAAQARATELFEAVRLPDPDEMLRRYPHQLSGGQRQRVLLAIALATDPDILLCDEPTTALDVTVQREVLDLLAELRATRGLSLLFVSHDLAVVAELCSSLRSSTPLNRLGLTSEPAGSRLNRVGPSLRSSTPPVSEGSLGASDSGLHQTGDRVVVFRDGRLVEQGTASDIVNRPAHPYTRALVDAVLPLPALADVGGDHV